MRSKLLVIIGLIAILAGLLIPAEYIGQLGTQTASAITGWPAGYTHGLPITISQPEVTAGAASFAASKDSYMQDTTGDTNYGTATSIYVLKRSAPPGVLRLRPIIGFDISGIPDGNIITSAKLYLYYYGYAYGDPNGLQVDTFECSRHDWTEGTGGSTDVSWNHYTGTTHWSNAGGDYAGTAATANCPAAAGWMSWTITNIAIDAYENHSGLVDLILKFNSETTTIKDADFYSREYTGNTSRCPYLDVDYLGQSELTDYQVRIPVRAGTNPITTVSPEQSLNGGTYSYYMDMTVTEYSNTTLTDYQFKADVDTAWLVDNGYASASGNEVRWTDTSNNLLDFWLETGGAGAGWDNANTYYWVESDCAALGTSTIRMWFDPSTGNSTSVSSMTNTFPIFFDDFDDASIDAAKWTYTADATESSGQIQVGNATTVAKYFRSVDSDLAQNTRVRFSGYLWQGGGGSRFGASRDGNNSLFYIGDGAFHLWIEYYDNATNVDLASVVSDANHIFEIDKCGSESVAGMTRFQMDWLSDFPLDTTVGTVSMFKTWDGYECPAPKQIEGSVMTANCYTRMQWVFVSQYVSPEPTVTYSPLGDPDAIFLENHSLSWPFDTRFFEYDASTEVIGNALDFWRDPETQFVSSNDYCVDYLVKIPTIPAPTGNVSIWLAYGSSGETDYSDGEATFDFFNTGNTTADLTVVAGNWTTETQQKPLFYGVKPYHARALSLFKIGDEWKTFAGFVEVPPGADPPGNVNPHPYKYMVYDSPDLTTWGELPTVPFYLEGNWIEYRGPWSISATSAYKDGVYYIPVSGGGLNSATSPLGALGIVSTSDFETYSIYAGNPVLTAGDGGFSSDIYDFSLIYEDATSQWIVLASDGFSIYWGNSTSVYGPYTYRDTLYTGATFVEINGLYEEDGTYYMYFDESAAYTDGEIQYATCSDPPPWDDLSFTDQGAVTLPAYEWDYSTQINPCLTWDSENSRWIMSYAGIATYNIWGDNGQNGYIGWATSPDLTDGGNWTAQNTQTEIKQSTTTAAYQVATITGGSYSNYAVDAEIIIKNGASAVTAGFVYNYVDSSNYYAAYLTNAATDVVKIDKHVAAAVTNIASANAAVPVVPGQKMRLSAQSYQGYQNIKYSKWGVKWYETDRLYDASLAASGNAGLLCYTAGANVANVRVRQYVYPEPTFVLGGAIESAPLDIVTLAATFVKSTSATLNGNVTGSDASAESVGFVYGTVNAGDPGDVPPSASGWQCYMVTNADTPYEQGETFSLSTACVVCTGNCTSIKLVAETLYYFMAWGNSTIGVSDYGEVGNFTTLAASGRGRVAIGPIFIY